MSKHASYKLHHSPNHDRDKSLSAARTSSPRSASIISARRFWHSNERIRLYFASHDSAPTPPHSATILLLWAVPTQISNFHRTNFITHTQHHTRTSSFSSLQKNYSAPALYLNSLFNQLSNQQSAIQQSFPVLYSSSIATLACSPTINTKRNESQAKPVPHSNVTPLKQSEKHQLCHQRTNKESQPKQVLNTEQRMRKTSTIPAHNTPHPHNSADTHSPPLTADTGFAAFYSPSPSAVSPVQTPPTSSS